MKKTTEDAAATPVTVHTRSGFIKNVLKLIMIIGIAGEIGLIFYTHSKANVKSTIHRVPYANPTSIAYDGIHIWVTDWVTQSFYKHSIDKSFTLIQTYFIPETHPTGITFDGKYLWSSNSWESLIFKHKLDEDLTILEAFLSPGPEPSGLYWDGAYLWVCDLQLAKIFKTKVGDDGLTAIAEYNSPGNNPVGIFSDGSHFWVGDSETNLIYKLNKNFDIISTYVTSHYMEKGYRLSSIGWDGKSIWSCSEENHLILRDTFKSLKKMNF